ncbi:MAG: small basic protein [Candidatus Omnitrophica bacterium CG11_big_fil_rev_8_21_14_0_20_64_10]|nr:MAG: small basic protein [Candidatus Omnitrophica bacterium CG11_big_fil_rev_8_21_14_0_20_64_10]
MSIHSSFKAGDTMKRHRSVLSRLERIKILRSEKEWDLQTASFQGLPKVKHLKVKAKKAKAAGAAEKEGAGGAAGAPAAGAPAAGAAGKKPAEAAKKPAEGAKKAAEAPKKK